MSMSRTRSQELDAHFMELAQGDRAKLEVVGDFMRDRALKLIAASGGDQRQTADFVGSMVVGSVASLVFVVACWFGLRHEWGFLMTLASAAVVWLLLALLPHWVG